MEGHEWVDPLSQPESKAYIGERFDAETGLSYPRRSDHKAWHNVRLAARMGTPGARVARHHTQTLAWRANLVLVAALGTEKRESNA